jgi:thiamine transport system substrate-binding protein
MSNIKGLNMRIIIFILFLFITSPHTTIADEVAIKPTLTVYTYDSFTSDWGPGPKIKEEFEKECNCYLNFVGLTDAVEILSRIQFEGKETKADIVLGLDDNLIADAKKNESICKKFYRSK